MSSEDAKQFDKPPGSPLLSLGEVCSDLRQKESFIEVETSPDKDDLKEEVKKETLACFDHSPCFYCKPHEKFLSEPKPSLMLSSQASSDNHEFKGKNILSLSLSVIFVFFCF